MHSSVTREQEEIHRPMRRSVVEISVESSKYSSSFPLALRTTDCRTLAFLQNGTEPAARDRPSRLLRCVAFVAHTITSYLPLWWDCRQAKRRRRDRRWRWGRLVQIAFLRRSVDSLTRKSCWWKKKKKKCLIDWYDLHRRVVDNWKQFRRHSWWSSWMLCTTLYSWLCQLAWWEEKRQNFVHLTLFASREQSRKTDGESNYSSSCWCFRIKLRKLDASLMSLASCDKISSRAPTYHVKRAAWQSTVAPTEHWNPTKLWWT